MIPALGHSYQNKYTFNENEHYRKCARCDDKIDAEAHTPDYEEATEEHGITCTGCGYVITESLEHDHTAEKQVEAKPAGCSTSGNLAYYVCRCGKLFLDAECNTPTDKKSVTVKALGHKLNYVEGKAATCTEAGISSGYHCERCDSDLSGFEVIEALGHTYENGKCVVCGECDPDYDPETPDVPDVPAEGNVKYYFEMSEGDAKIKFYFYDNYTVEAKMYEDEDSDPHVETAMWMMVDDQVAVVYDGSVVQKFVVTADGYTLVLGQIDSETIVYTFSDSYKDGSLTVNVLVVCYKDGSCEIRSATVNEKGEEYDTDIQNGIWVESGKYVVIGNEYMTPVPFTKTADGSLVPVEYVNDDKTCDHKNMIHINTVYRGCERAETMVYLCLLCGTEGDSRERILSDIETARRHFEYFSINFFCDNTTAVKADAKLARWFATEIAPTLAHEPGIEILMNNTDLGVGD